MEVGAVALRIDAIGDENALAALAKLDAGAAGFANQLNAKLTPAQKALNREIAEGTKLFALQGRTADASNKQQVQSIRQVAAAQANYLLSVGASEAQLLQFAQAVQAFEKRVTSAARSTAQAEEASNQRRSRSLDEYIAKLTKAAGLSNARAEGVRRLVVLEEALTQKLRATNLTLDQQITLGLRLQAVQRGIASGTEQVAVAQTKVASTARATTTGVQVFGQQIVAANGRVSAFGKSGLNAFSALAFGASQMAASGTASFRSLATSAASVLSFFGTGGAIAAAVTATGLVIVDVFTRSRREIEETRKKARDEAAALQKELGQIANQGDLQGFADRERDIRQGTPAGRDGVPFADALTDMQAEALRLGSLLQQIGDLSARKAVGDQSAAASLKTLLESIGNDVEAKQEERDLLLAEIRTKEVELAAIIRRRQTSAASQLGTVTIEGRKPKTAEEIDKERAAEIEALNRISQARKLTAVEVVRLAQLERQGAQELRNSHPTKEREAELWERITKARKAAALSLPAAAVQSITSSTSPAATTLTAPGTITPATLPKVNIADPMVLAMEQDLLRLASSASNGASIRAAAQMALDGLSGQMGPLSFTQQVEVEFLLNSAAAVDQAFAKFLPDVSAVLIDALGSAFSGEKASDVILKGIGGIFQQMGAALISYGLIMQGLLPALLNPFTSGPAALAAGAALVALGSALKGAATGKGGGAGAGGGSSSPGGGLDTIRSFVTGSNANDPLTGLSKGLRDTIEQLRASTFGTPGMTSLSGARIASRSAGIVPVSAMPNPLKGLRFLAINEPGGQSKVALVVNEYNRDRGGR